MLHNLVGPTADWPIQFECRDEHTRRAFDEAYNVLFDSLQELEHLTDRPIIQCTVPF